MSAGIDAERREDMSMRGRLRLIAQPDGDMCLAAIADDGTMAGIEFCNSGGRSPHTLQALRDLSHAMKRDNDGAPWAVDATPAAVVRDQVAIQSRLIKDGAHRTMHDGIGGCDALYQLAVDHGADQTKAAGLAHTVNGAFALMECNVSDGCRLAAAAAANAPVSVVDVAWLQRLETLLVNANASAPDRLIVDQATTMVREALNQNKRQTS